MAEINYDQLPQFKDWQYYETMDPAQLEQLCSEWRAQEQAVRQQMAHKEIIVGRTKRYKTWLSSKCSLDRIEDTLLKK
jgi:hypothetical protein